MSPLRRGEILRGRTLPHVAGAVRDGTQVSERFAPMARSPMLPGMSDSRRGARPNPRFCGLLCLLLAGLGCRQPPPPATVEGVLRVGGKPADNCLVTFFPESGHDPAWAWSTGRTDSQGRFRLRNGGQQDGAAVGLHRVTIQDLSVSQGTPRRDHGTVDEDLPEERTPAPVRRSRVPAVYLALTQTPLSREVKPGHQVVELDLP